MTSEPQETELKFRIASREDFDALAETLKRTAGPPKEQAQKNHFFDRRDREMLARKMTLRLRNVKQISPTGREFWLLALKGDADLTNDGLMVVFEDEHEVPAELAEAILADPGSLDSLEDRTLALARERFPCPSGHVKMGHYATTRLKFPVAGGRDRNQF